MLNAPNISVLPESDCQATRVWERIQQFHLYCPFNWSNPEIYFFFMTSIFYHTNVQISWLKHEVSSDQDFVLRTNCPSHTSCNSLDDAFGVATHNKPYSSSIIFWIKKKFTITLIILLCSTSSIINCVQ